MSGIFGIYHPNDKPINSVHLRKMADAIAHRGPDGTKTVLRDHIGFGHSMLQTTPESVNEILPFTDLESGLTITADARIDNREELAEKLSLHQLTNISDSQLILLAFNKWGYESFQFLIGDFAFVIWNPINQQLVCVRDYIGIKPFYYHYTPARFLFSSEVKQLAQYPDVSLKINENIVGEYLSFSFCSKIESLFTDITRLAPAHYLLVRPNSISTHKYWSWEPKNRIRYKTTAEYTEHFIEVFKHSVQSHLRCNGRISAELSGGLDSSTVVGMASNLLPKQNNKQLQIYSLIFPGLICDETPFINAVSNFNSIKVNFIPYSNYIAHSWKEQILHTFEPPDFPNLSMNNPLLSSIQASGSRVVLSGIGGDECFTGSGYPYMDYLQDLNFTKLFKEFRQRQKQRTLQSIKELAINMSWPLTPASLRKCITQRTAKNHIPKWLSRTFINRIQMAKKIQQTDPRLFLSNLSGNSYANIFSQAGVPFFLEQLDKQRAFWKIENRYPFLDRRIFEFAMSIPDYEKQQMGQIKHILRQPGNYLIPAAIKKRKDKTEFSCIFNQTFYQSLFLMETDQLSFAKMDWINASILNDTIRAKMKAIKLDKYAISYKTWELWFAFSINIWYKVISNIKK